MTLLLYLATALTLFSAAGLIALSVFSRKPRAAMQRVVVATKGDKILEVTGPTGALHQQIRVGVRWLRSRLGGPATDKLQYRFSQAGLNTDFHIDAFLGARMAGPVFALVLGSFMPSHRFSWMVALAGIAYLAPDILLERLIKRRRRKMAKSVPDAIDLLVICVDAGLGLDQAMLRVGLELSASHPQLNEEFVQISREQRAGKLRLDAWKGMAERSKLPEIEGFVNMLMQTERFGTPIARALSKYAVGIRLKRRQTAEQKAAKTTVKIIFPLVFFIFPCMFIVLLGPAVIQVMHTLANRTQ